MKSIIKFTDLLNRFRLVKRTLWSNNEERMESDVDHSYMLAMLAWYIIRTKNLNLKLEKIFMYALAHDLVEVYSGDVAFFKQDEETRKIKETKEKEAAETLKKEFPEFPELHDIIASYEIRQDPEAKFIYALDKIQPVINIYLDNGRTWKTEKITLEMLLTKREKVKIDPQIAEYFEEIVGFIEKDKDKFF
jgi:putative hydrolases of HD superfamily